MAFAPDSGRDNSDSVREMAGLIVEFFRGLIDE